MTHAHCSAFTFLYSSESTTLCAGRKMLSNYANLCMLVDEHVDGSVIDHLDAQVIVDFLLMRPSKHAASFKYSILELPFFFLSKRSSVAN